MSLAAIWSAVLGFFARPALAAAVAFAAGAGASAWLVAELKAADIAEIKLAWTEQRLADAQAASRAFADAWALSEKLNRRLTAERRAAAAIQEMYDDALTRSTDGRACLREPALRVLDLFPGVAIAAAPPQAGRDAARADAERIATDADVARWAKGAGNAYAECVRRLDALIDWTESGDTE